MTGRDRYSSDWPMRMISVFETFAAGILFSEAIAVFSELAVCRYALYRNKPAAENMMHTSNGTSLLLVAPQLGQVVSL